MNERDLSHAARRRARENDSELVLRLTENEAQAVHKALYLRLRELSMVEDHNPDARRRAEARNDAAPVISAADKLLDICPGLKA